MYRALALVALALASTALAQAPSGQLTKPPALLKQVEAVYPPDAADAGVGGTVVMEVDIGPDGKVLEARVVQSATAAFDAAALEAVRQFEFSPAEIDGQPAAVRIQYAYQFLMRQEIVPVALDGGAPDGGPVVNLAGLLRLSGTREPVVGAQVVLGEGEALREAVSGEDGRFGFEDVAPGSWKLVVTNPGLERFEATEEVKPGERTEVVYSLRSRGDELQTVVRAERERREVAQVKLVQSEVRYIPGTQGEAFKVIQNLPGVARTSFGQGALVIRGSKSWDSRVYIDEIFIPQLFHFGGVTATYNSNLVDDITFEPGNFGAPFGRSIGGLIQATGRTPSKTTLHGYVDVNLFDVSAMVETPVSEGWSLAAAGRRGLVDLTVPFALRTFAPQAASVLAFQVTPVYWDYQVRAEWKPKKPGTRFFISLFGSSDAWAFVLPIPFLDPEAEGNQGSYGSTVLYNRLVVGADARLSERVRFTSRNSVGLDRYSLLGTSTNVYFNNAHYPIQLRERFDVDVPEVKVQAAVGVDLLVVPAVLDAQKPPAFNANLIPDPGADRRLLAEHSTTVHVEPGAFVELAWTPFDSLKVLGGLRVDYQSYMQKAWADPRLSIIFSPIKALTLKGAFGIYHQPPDYRTGQLSPIFGNPGLLPEAARHYMAGAELRFTDFLELDLQAYYKDFFDQSRQQLLSGIGSDVNVPGAETRYQSNGYGRAYGAEVLLRLKPWKGLSGWIAYSLSRFQRDYFGGVNQDVVNLPTCPDREFFNFDPHWRPSYPDTCMPAYAPGPLDQPHNLIIVLSYKLPLDFIVGARFRYASGPLVTPFVTSLYDAQGNYFYPLAGLPWSERLPDFVQLDLRVDKRFVFKSWVLAAYVDVQNLTNQKNPEGIFYNFDYSERQYVYGIPILPTIGLRGEW